ncbi:hypothetical protein F4604DRAFT_459359 [Suillus subluteus]|nr:hypothetical protein F4604DRAFT_459359 [Suillus subluteus]
MISRQILFIPSPPPPPPPPRSPPPPRPYTPPFRARLVLFLCCASPQHIDYNAKPTQQQEQGQVQTHATSSQTQRQQCQSQGQVQAQGSPPQTQPAAAPLTSATPTSTQSDPSYLKSADTASPGAGPAQHSLPVRLLGHLALFLCCVCDHRKADSNLQPIQPLEDQSQRNG